MPDHPAGPHAGPVTHEVLVLGAGFGGLELAARLSQAVPGEVTVTLVDQDDAFLFGFSKLDLMLGRASRDQLRCPYASIRLPGVEFRQERVLRIDPTSRHVETDAGGYDPDTLVVALGADYDLAATPGFAEGGHEYYSPAGAERLRDALRGFGGGDLVVAVLGVPFKCPPAPFEGAMLLHEHLVAAGVRDRTRITVVSPMETPVPVSAETSRALVDALAERDIAYLPGRLVRELDPAARVARTLAGDLPYDLFVGIPVHRVPAVVAESGLTAGGNDGWVAVDRHTLATPYPGVYALGDCADAPVPRAGVFAETAARTVADGIVHLVRGGPAPAPYDGTGSCYIEFGGGRVAKVDADVLGGTLPRAPFTPPSVDLAGEKREFAATRRQRWFGLGPTS
jgi:sulfide:quinone oxidoreductase